VGCFVAAAQHSINPLASFGVDNISCLHGEFTSPEESPGRPLRVEREPVVPAGDGHRLSRSRPAATIRQSRHSRSLERRLAWQNTRTGTRHRCSLSEQWDVARTLRSASYARRPKFGYWVDRRRHESRALPVSDRYDTRAYPRGSEANRGGRSLCQLAGRIGGCSTSGRIGPLRLTAE